MLKLLRELKNAIYLKNPIYNILLENKSENKLLLKVEDFWGGDPDIGRKIIGGYINFFGEGINYKHNIWERNNASRLWNQELHSFDWIKNLRAVGTNKSRLFLRDSVSKWLLDNRNWVKSTWDKEILARRVVNLLTNLSFFYETADEGFKTRLSKNINKQCFFLFSRFENKIVKKNEIYIVKAYILASLSYKNLSHKFNFSLRKLNQLIDNNLSEDGMHYLRSPSEHLKFLQSLIDIKLYLGGAKIRIPVKLNNTIYLMSSVLKFFKMGNGELSIFNKYDFVEKNMIEKVLKRANSKIGVPTELKTSGFNRISKNRLNLIMDCGSPSIEETHAGTLSFEMSHGAEKIIVNCGSPFINNKQWGHAMRSTAAHSTVNIENVNSSDIFFNKESRTRIAKAIYQKVIKGNNYWIDTKHYGYSDIFGLIHNRRLYVETNNLIIKGEDCFTATKNFKTKDSLVMNIRFHIHPDIKSSVTESKKKAVLQLKNNLGWEFICSESKIKIKEGIYLGGKKIVQKNNHILISKNIINGEKIRWMFRFIR